MIEAVPAPTPDTIPDEFTVATAVLLQLHVPGMLLPLIVYCVAEPTHTDGAPATEPAVGGSLTVRLAEAVDGPQLILGTLYVIKTLPVAIPETTPEASTVATFVLLLLQVPPGVASVKAGVDEPTHTVEAPPPTGATTTPR